MSDGRLLGARCGRASWALCSDNGMNNELMAARDLCGEPAITRVV
jgi:hypothetical protein